MRRASFLLLAALAVSGCTLIASGRAESDVARQIASLTAGSRCRVTLEPVEEKSISSSQLTYEGTVEKVNDNGLTLKDASLVATSHTPPPVVTNIPVIDRTFSRVTVVEQSLDAPVTIPIATIEQITRLDESASETGD